MFRRWHYLILIFAIAWSGFHAFQWYEMTSGLERMGSRSDVATVVRIDKRKETSGSGKKGRRKTTTYYRPVIEFEDSDHISHTAPSIHESANASLHLTGDEVSVLYDPRDANSGCIIVGEEEATKKEASGKLFATIGILVSGIVLFASAEIFFRAAEKAEERGPKEQARDDGASGELDDGDGGDDGDPDAPDTSDDGQAEQAE